jgi:hypothetical protein
MSECPIAISVDQKKGRSTMFNKRIALLVIVVVVIVLAVVFVSLAGPALMNALIKMHMGN